MFAAVLRVVCRWPKSAFTWGYAYWDIHSQHTHEPPEQVWMCRQWFTYYNTFSFIAMPIMCMGLPSYCYTEQAWAWRYDSHIMILFCVLRYLWWVSDHCWYCDTEIAEHYSIYEGVHMFDSECDLEIKNTWVVQKVLPVCYIQDQHCSEKCELLWK